jgi:hypothetical protein
MNWLTKAISLGEKIKKVLRKRPSKEEIENSDWTSCCKGPIIKKDLENNLWVQQSKPMQKQSIPNKLDEVNQRLFLQT